MSAALDDVAFPKRVSLPVSVALPACHSLLPIDATSTCTCSLKYFIPLPLGQLESNKLGFPSAVATTSTGNPQSDRTDCKS